MAIYNKVNIGGIPCIKTTGSVVTGTTSAVYNFDKVYSAGRNFSGLLAVKLVTPATVTAATPVFFNVPGVSNSQIALTAQTGAQATSDNFGTAGIYMVFYDREDNVLQLI